MRTRQTRAGHLTTRDELVEPETGVRGGTGRRVGRPICEIHVNEVTGVVVIRVRVDDHTETRPVMDIHDTVRVVDA